MFLFSRKSLFAAFLIASAASGTRAQPISDAELQRRQTQQQEQAQSLATPKADVFTPTDADGDAPFTLPEETSCFPISDIEWRGIERLKWLAKEGEAVAGHCIGARGLRAFQNHLMRLLIDEGYVTSRVLIPEQNLSSGTLALQVVPGVIGKIRDQGEPIGRNGMVFPEGEGELLNQRDLDQALENMRRLMGQQGVEFDLVPGEQLGETDIVIKHPEADRWRGLLTLDDSGADSTGKYQLGAVISVDSLLRLYDSLTVALNRNANFGNSHLGTHSASVSWSAPIGYWSFLMSAYQSDYKQTVAGFDGDIVYTGDSYGMEIGLSRVPYRTSNAKGLVQVKLNRRMSSSYIEDQELDVQHRDLVGYDISFNHRHYLDRHTIDVGLGIKGSLPTHSDTPGIIVGQPDWDGRYQIYTAQASLSSPIRIGNENFSYYGSLRVQHATTALPNYEHFSIGGRYTVRGFDGMSTLAAEDGWLLRNDFGWAIGRSGQELFIGIDAGKVSGPTASTLLGKYLAGIVLGARGAAGRFNYEFTIGRPLSRPDGFQTENLTLTAAIAASF